MPTTDEIRRELDATEFSAGMIHGVDCSCSQCRIARYCRLLCDEVDADIAVEEAKAAHERGLCSVDEVARVSRVAGAARRAREEAP